MNLKVTTLFTSLLMVNAVSAATAIDLRHQPASYLQRTFLANSSLNNQSQMQTTRRDIDFNHTTHTRLQETYAGVPVLNATAVVHTPSSRANATMNGIIYQGLEKDLSSTPAYALTAEQQSKALQQAKESYAKLNRINSLTSKEETTKKIIYIDQNNQAHYGYLVSFYLDDGQTGAHRPTMLVDATSLAIYSSWDQVKTIRDSHIISDSLTQTMGGGIGGNEKIGEVIYDGDTTNGHAIGLPMSDYQTDVEVLPGQKLKFSYCILDTNDVVVQDVSYAGDPAHQYCYVTQGLHNNVTWLSWDKNGTRWKDDEVNGGYSPSLDALYGATIVKNMYNDWYQIPVLTLEDGKTPMKLVMRVHYGRKFENAFWDGKQMTFGDGDRTFYPLTSLDVTAHEISHGFTTQHSNIDGEHSLAMGALHEAFSDMAAVAARYYVNGKVVWDLGRDITKGESALRYVSDPKKDGRSIDNLKDFDESIGDPHLAAGIFNKAFYLIATTKGWDVHKAFNIMVKANMHYWTSSMRTFGEAACGVVSATKDYNYDVADVRVAFGNVGIDTSNC